MPKNNELACWCGKTDFSAFSENYVLCNNCKTLMLSKWEDKAYFQVNEDDRDFYGKSYWFEHQENDLGYSSIEKRARTDITERALYWAKTVLKYKIPPGVTLEIGCGHGGFVSLLKWIGFEASGLELSPWVTDFAHNTFDIPMYTGDIEDQSIPPESLDVIIMMDVLEHLPDPVKSLTAIRKLLKTDGILVIQTPCFPEISDYQQMKEDNDPFLLQLKPPEHLFLFSKGSAKQLLSNAGFSEFIFEKAFFNQYDMFLIASSSSLMAISKEEIEKSMLATASGRLVLALFDINNALETLSDQLDESEADRVARYEQIQQFRVWLEESDTDQKARYDQIQQYKKLLEESEIDRAARLTQIQQYKALLEESEADRIARFEQIQEYMKLFEESEKDRAARFEQIQQYQKLLEVSELARAEQTELIQNYKKMILNLDNELSQIKSHLVYRIANRLGLWN